MASITLEQDGDTTYIKADGGTIARVDPAPSNDGTFVSLEVFASNLENSPALTAVMVRIVDPA